jgi:hypothetical protein
VLASHYPDGIRFTVNGRELAKTDGPEGRRAVAIRLPRKRKPAAAGYLFRGTQPLAEDARGVAISTLGKVIKRGWDWLGITPTGADRIGGLIEAPALANCLTLNKADFLRSGARGATFLAFRKAIQEAIAEPLAEWGEGHEATDETRRRKARPLERDLRDVLGGLARDFPLLDALAMRRPGGQRRLAIGGGADSGDEEPLLPIGHGADDSDKKGDAGASSTEPAPPRAADAESADADRNRRGSESRLDVGVRGRKRRAHLGLRIDFEQRPDDPSLGRLVESTIWVNESHPAYQRALASRLQAYHLAVTVAMTLAPLAVEPGAAHEFVSAFLDRWGKVGSRRR